MMSVCINFGTQVIMVRYLTRSDYGALAYALSVVSFCAALSTLGLDRGVTRFVPIYHEQKAYGKMFGTILFIVGTTLAVALLIAGLFHVFPQQFGRLMGHDKQPVLLLLVLIALVPIDTLDNLLVALFACFVSPRAIFIRKHVLAPGLRFAVVFALAMLGENVRFLAGGYLAANAIGLFVFCWLLIRMARSQGLIDHFRLRSVRVPVREILSFTVPVMTSDLVSVFMLSLNVIILGFFHSTSEVALYRAVIPVAALNTLVTASFGLLFTPAAARLFARNDGAGINDLYWRTASWTAICTFPIFAVTFGAAGPLTVFVYGHQYGASATCLTALAFGYYFSAALGFNGLTLKVVGKLRFIVVINLAAAALNLGLNLVLIPRYGALGAAMGTALTLVLHNILKQAGLRLSQGLSVFDRAYRRLYLAIGLGILALLPVRLAVSNLYVAVGLTLLVSGAVFLATRKRLEIGQTFPVLLRFPLVRVLLAS